MEEMHHYPLSDGQYISIQTNSSDSQIREAIVQYYKWNEEQKDWEKPAYHIMEHHGFKSPNTFHKWIAGSLSALWHKGECKNKAIAEGCESKVTIDVSKRGDFEKVKRNGIDNRPRHIVTDDGWTSSHAILRAFDSGLCNSCLQKAMKLAHEQDKLEENERRRKAALDRQNQEIATNIKITEAKTLINTKLSSVEYYSTGFSNIDKILYGGIKKGVLNVIAANPYQDAYSCFLSIINHQATQHRKAVYISLSKSQDEMELSLLANRIGVPLVDLEQPTRLSDQKSLQLAETLRTEELIILESKVNKSIDIIEQVIDQYSHQGIQLFFLDSLQDIQIGQADKSFVVNAEQIFSTNCRRLNRIIKENSITVIAVSLLNNNIDRRDADARFKNKDLRIPRLSDLRDSNVLYTLAYNVIFLHRSEFYDTKSGNFQDVTMILAVNGDRTNVGTCTIWYDHKTGGLTNTVPSSFKTKAEMYNEEAKLYIQKGSIMNDLNFDEGFEDAPF